MAYPGCVDVEETQRLRGVFLDAGRQGCRDGVLQQTASQPVHYPLPLDMDRPKMQTYYSSLSHFSPSLPLLLIPLSFPDSTNPADAFSPAQKRSLVQAIAPHRQSLLPADSVLRVRNSRGDPRSVCGWRQSRAGRGIDSACTRVVGWRRRVDAGVERWVVGSRRGG